MKILSTTALGLALALGGVAVATPAAAAKEKEAKPAAMDLSPKVRTGAVAAQGAIAKSDFAGAQAAIAAVEPEIKTPDDKYVLGQLSLQIAQKTNDQALFGKAVGMMVDSGKAPPEQAAQLQLVRGKIAYQAKDYTLAETSLLAAQAAGSTDADLVPVLVESMHNNGKDLAAIQMLSAAVDKAQAAGQPVPENWYARGISIGYQVKPGPDKAAIAELTAALSRKWIAAYPTKSNYRDAVIIYRDSNRLDPDTELDLYRLLGDAGALKGERDYMDYVLAVYLRNPGEAQRVLAAGTSSGQVPPTSKNALEIKGIVDQKVAADKASLASSERSSQAAANGKVAMNTADGYLGYQEWAKAATLYKLALQKGGVDANVINVRLGMALAKSGDAAGAKAALATVTGARKPLADFWLLYLDHPPTA